MNWNLEGLHVTGWYMGSIPVEGCVEESRVKYGGTISHTVVLDSPIIVFGAKRERVILEHADIEAAIC
jgi:hypothetical protein